MPETQQRFQFRLRHLFLIVTGLCAFLGVSVAIPWLAFLLGFVLVVGSAMARVSTRSRRLWIVGPVFAMLGGLVGILLSVGLLSILPLGHSPLVGLGLFFPPTSGVVIGGWYGGRLERKYSSI